MKVNYLGAIYFWSGMAVLAIINNIQNIFRKNQALYNWYILGISIIAIIIFTILNSRKKKR